jgi:hypothetical protein
MERTLARGIDLAKRCSSRPSLRRNAAAASGSSPPSCASVAWSTASAAPSFRALCDRLAAVGVDSGTTRERDRTLTA